MKIFGGIADWGLRFYIFYGKLYTISIIKNQLQAVFCIQQSRQKKCSVKTLRFPLSVNFFEALRVELRNSTSEMKILGTK